MEAQTDRNRRRQLIIWWSTGGLALLVILSLLFWVGYRSGETPPPVVNLRPASEPTSSGVAQPPPVTEISPPPNTENDSDPEDQPSTDPQPILPTPEDMPDADPPPDDVSDQTSLQSPGDDLLPKLPDDWDELSPADKISLNPFSCDLSREEIDLDNGLCRRRSTLSSKSKPWNPMALNLVSTTEVEDRFLKIACYNQDLSHLLNTPSEPTWPGGVDWPSLVNMISESSPDINNGVTVRSSVGINNNLDNNKGSQHCILRVALEMTIDGFYFPNGCRTWQPGFVKLVGTENGEDKTYSSLSTPGPDVLCTKNTVPIAKGQQIEQIFLFSVPDSDLSFKVTQIGFDWLEPKLTFNGNFGFKSETKLPTSNPLQSL